jgi:hypothetical protein
MVLGEVRCDGTRMFTIGGATAQILRNLVAARLLGWKLPQTRSPAACFYSPAPDRCNKFPMKWQKVEAMHTLTIHK